jgi:hypothetical protein
LARFNGYYLEDYEEIHKKIIIINNIKYSIIGIIEQILASEMRRSRGVVIVSGYNHW